MDRVNFNPDTLDPVSLPTVADDAPSSVGVSAKVLVPASIVAFTATSAFAQAANTSNGSNGYFNPVNPLDATLQATSLAQGCVALLSPYIGAWIPIAIVFTVIGFLVRKVTHRSKRTA